MATTRGVVQSWSRKRNEIDKIFVKYCHNVDNRKKLVDATPHGHHGTHADLFLFFPFPVFQRSVNYERSIKISVGKHIEIISYVHF